MGKGAVLLYVEQLHSTEKQLLVAEERQSLFKRLFKSTEEIFYTGDDLMVPVMMTMVREMKKVGINMDDVENVREELIAMTNLNPVELENALESKFGFLIKSLTQKAAQDGKIKIMAGSDFFVDLEEKYSRLIDLVYQNKLSSYGKDLEEIVQLLSKLRSSGRKPQDCKKILHKVVIKDGMGTIRDKIKNFQ